jgi:hypothetical protein
MHRITVTVKRKDEARVHDLEVPADLDATRLAEMIAHDLHWDIDSAGQPSRYKIEVHWSGGMWRTMKPGESLAGVGASDGLWLVFCLLGNPPLQSSSDQPPAGPEMNLEELDIKWRPLGISLPGANAPTDSEVPAKTPGSEGKRVD